MTPDLNKLRFIKLHRKKRIIRLNKGRKGSQLSNYDFGMITKRKAVITYSQIESIRKLIVRKLKGKSNKNQRNLKIIKSQVNRKQKRKKSVKNNFNFRRNFCLGLTKKPLQVRMGKGKGNPVDWVYPCAKNRVILEFSLLKAKKRRVKKILLKASKKLPTEVKFIQSRLYKSKYLRINKNIVSNVSRYCSKNS